MPLMASASFGRGRHVVARGIDRHLGDLPEGLAGERVEPGDGLDLVAEELDADARLLVGGDDLHHVAPHPEGAALQLVVVPVVARLHQLGQEIVAVEGVALAHEEQHPVVGLGRAEAVDARDRGHDHDVAPLEQAAGRGEAQAVDLVVDRRFLLDVGVGLGNVGLGLVVVVVGDEVLHGVLREEGLELLVELGGEGLVVGQDQGRAVDPVQDRGDGEGLAAARHPEQHLVLVAAKDPRGQLVDGPRLVALRLEVADQLEMGVGGGGSQTRLVRPRLARGGIRLPGHFRMIHAGPARPGPEARRTRDRLRRSRTMITA